MTGTGAPSSGALQPWSARAINLPDHQDNPVHTDTGAKAAGFPSALVAGVSVYALLTHPVVAARPSWLRVGCGEVFFRSPVFHDDEVELIPQNASEDDGGDWSDVVEARVSGVQRALLRIGPGRPLEKPPANGAQVLRSLEVPLTGNWADYGQRCGETLPLYTDDRIVHPAMWPVLANLVFRDQLVSGSWVHTRSLVRHHGVARTGSIATVRTTVVRRFTTRSGERAVAHVGISCGGELVAEIEHEAIVGMTDAAT